MSSSDRIALRNLRIRATQLTDEDPHGYVYYVVPHTFRLCRRRPDGSFDGKFVYQGN